ncbi:MAG: hypothetical protein IJ762_10470 [Bacteroidaceae bacterium]|nr:hypothetical protein [Bacteroidaceae bacterium]
MSIKYSLLPRSSSPRDDQAPRLVYAAAQSTETVGLRQLAHHLASHHSVFSEGTIIGLLTDFQRCILEQLQSGARVDLEVLGAFYTTLQGRGAKSAEEFTPDLVDRINIRWRPSHEMEQAIQRTPLEFVLNRAEQRAQRKRNLAELNQEVEESRQHAQHTENRGKE